MFDAAYFDTEIAGLEAQLAEAVALVHRLEGALTVLRQMKTQLAQGAEEQPAPDTALSLDQLDDLLPEGFRVDQERGIKPHED